jgi:hypothetical protein
MQRPEVKSVKAGARSSPADIARLETTLLNPNTTGVPHGTPAGLVPPSPDVTPSPPPTDNHDTLHDPGHHPPAEPRSAFETVTQIGWLLLIGITLSEKAPLMLVVLVTVAAAYGVRKLRR